MRHTVISQRLVRVVLVVSAVVLTSTVTLLHQHDKSLLSHHTQSCRVCKIQESFSATTTAAPFSQPVLLGAVARVPSLIDRSPIPLFLYTAAPRSPPLFL